MALTITINQDGAETVITLMPAEETAMKNDLLDLSAWIVGAIRGKINNTKKRMVRAGIDELRKAGQMVPVSDDDVITDYKALSGYKDRTARDAEIQD